MRYEIIQRPSFSLVEVELEEGEAIKAEPGAMVHMSPTIKIETKTGGIFKALKRSMLGGESIFINTFRAEEGKGNIGLAPAYMGDIAALEIRETLYTQSGLPNL